jgi:cell division protein FtsB
MSLKAYVVSDSNDSVVITNMTEVERIKALEDEVYELKSHIKLLTDELDKAERKAYTGLGD